MLNLWIMGEVKDRAPTKVRLAAGGRGLCGGEGQTQISKVGKKKKPTTTFEAKQERKKRSLKDPCQIKIILLLEQPLATNASSMPEADGKFKS